jgi:hypothetical protein
MVGQGVEARILPGRQDGYAPTLEQALSQLTVNWWVWLTWAKLKEVNAPSFLRHNTPQTYF